MEQILIFLGDVMLGRLVNEKLKEKPPTFVWGDTLSILKKAQATFFNLECALTDWGEPYPNKIFCFRTDRKNVAVLKEPGITTVSLANNHLLDYGERGLLETLKNLKANGIFFAGAGRTSKKAQSPAFLKVGHLRICFLAATDNEREWEAKENSTGVFFSPIDLQDPRFKKLVALVTEGKKKSDLVIVSLHWGPNWGDEPFPEHRIAAHHLIENGADIIFGHSPHIFRGIEIYQNRPILYSCGDFVDDYAVDEVERNDQSFIFQIHVQEKRITKITLLPTIISDFQAQKASGWQKEAICQKMVKLCRAFKTRVIKTRTGLEIPLHPKV